MVNSNDTPGGNVMIVSGQHGFEIKTLFIEPEFLRCAEAARIYNISRAKIYELMREGKIEYVSLRKRGSTSGVRLIKLASIRKFMNDRLQGGENKGSK